VVAAVSVAIEIQQRIAAQEFAGRRLRMRIGVHYGDVLLREGTAHGDAINVAARLQSIARPGTICISDGVYRHVRHRFDEPI
jgi:adenylate cyclase